MAADPLYADPRIGTADVDSWRAVPVEDNPEGKRTWAWAVVAGEYADADDGDPDVYFEIRHAEYPKDVAKFIVEAVREKWARDNPSDPQSASKPTLDASEPIENLGFSTRTYNSLRRGGVDTVGDLTALNGVDLLDIRNFGRGQFEEVVNRLAEHGLKLQEPPRWAWGHLPKMKPAA